MNLVYGAVFLAVAGTGIYFVAKPHPADEYPLSISDAYNKLSSVQLGKGDKGPFGGLTTNVSGNGHAIVDWSGHGTFAAIDCTLTLAPIAPTNTKVAISCNGGGAAGAATGMLIDMMRKAAIEQVDATLTGRPYDPAKAEGATAWRWPEDTVHHAGLHESIGNAVQMGADMAKEGAFAGEQHAPDNTSPTTVTEPVTPAEPNQGDNNPQ